MGRFLPPGSVPECLVETRCRLAAYIARNDANVAFEPVSRDGRLPFGHSLSVVHPDVARHDARLTQGDVVVYGGLTRVGRAATQSRLSRAGCIEWDRAISVGK